MYVQINLTSVPPTSSMRESDDLKSLKVVVPRPEHSYMSVDELLRLAGDRAADPDWRERFDAMIAFARSKGWVDDDGAVRAHIEWAAE